METTVKSTEHEITWSQSTDFPIRHVTLPEVMESVARGIEQAAKGEGVEIDPKDLPTDDDD
jgi:hypothetical protein